ncbi:MAG: Dipeptide transport system permease protein DppC [Alphaproteobacteria bacterium MarineAlpha4_Bin2]|nr:MAG: Dipeptide transport system permease protein DppC [Alphaproteobacteria bacterium MarineAlpha4_Bin2]
MSVKKDNTQKLEHYVSDAPFDPLSIEALSPEQERYYLASQWRLMWWKFIRHRLALISGGILLVMYGSILISEFLAPYNLHSRNINAIYAPPQSVHLFHEGELLGPFVYGTHYQLNMLNLRREYTEDTSKIYRINFFCSGDEYHYWGMGKGNLHLFCVEKGGTIFLLGTDRLGRDILSRILYGARISLTIGLIGIILSFVLGMVIGGVAGYYGGVIDLVVQRMIEILQSFPQIPLWMALSAVLPVTWSPLLIYFGITVILAMLDWTGLARAVRSKLLALREEDYCLAAQLMGAKPKRIIGRHLMPGFMSHLIASATLSIPTMILGETALSFLGLGLRPPITSWGVLLNEAQNISVVALYPWLILPVVPVILVILAFSFLGDGLRDAADPYK